MSQQVQELIDKIKSEGIQTAEKRSKEIEEEARVHAAKIVDEAKKQAEKTKVDAKEEVKRLQESTHMALKQASRDTLLSLRKEINALLKSIVTKEIHSTLNNEQLGHIIAEAVKGAKQSDNIVVNLNPKDLDKLKDGFLSKLQHEVKGTLKFHGSADIASGFTISYDGGKSSFDFSDESLSGYMSAFLSSQVAELIKNK